MKHKIVFADNFSARKLRLIEVNSSLVQDIEKSQHLSIKSCNDDDDVVLCTKAQTYDLKKVDNSNTLYLLPPSSKDLMVVGNVKATYQLTLTKPKLFQINELLEPYQCNDGNLDNIDKSKYETKSSLFNKVQASNQEIETALSKLNVIEINGCLRMISSTYYREIIRHILNTIIEYDVSLDNTIDISLFISQNKHIDSRLIIFGLQKLSSCHVIQETETDNIDIQEKDIQLDYDKVALACAHDLFLKNNNKLWLCDDFELTWGSRLPGIKQPSLQLLQGIAIMETLLSLTDVKNMTVTSMISSHHNHHNTKSTSQSSSSSSSSSTSSSYKVYRYFPKEQLSQDIKKRFQELYGIRPSYTYEEITPYLEGFYGDIGQPKTLDALLILYTKKIDTLYHML